MVKCEICNEKFNQLPSHLKFKHNMSGYEYKQRFNSELIDEYIRECHIRGGRNSQKTLKTKNLSFYNSKIQSKLGKKGGSKSQKTLKNKKLSFYNPKIQTELSIRARKAQLKNKPYWFLNVPFDSNTERKVAKQLFLAGLFLPEEGLNCHVRVNGGEIDFKLFNFLWVEYHSWDRKNKKNIKKYYKVRRKILNKNGFKNTPLIVLKSVKNINKFCKLFT